MVDICACAIGALLLARPCTRILRRSHQCCMMSISCAEVWTGIRYIYSSHSRQLLKRLDPSVATTRRVQRNASKLCFFTAPATRRCKLEPFLLLPTEIVIHNRSSRIDDGTDARRFCTDTRIFNMYVSLALVLSLVTTHHVPAFRCAVVARFLPA